MGQSNLYDFNFRINKPCLQKYFKCSFLINPYNILVTLTKDEIVDSLNLVGQ